MALSNGLVIVPLIRGVSWRWEYVPYPYQSTRDCAGLVGAKRAKCLFAAIVALWGREEARQSWSNVGTSYAGVLV
jgi:hypothetical protein